MLPRLEQLPKALRHLLAVPLSSHLTARALCRVPELLTLLLLTCHSRRGLLYTHNTDRDDLEKVPYIGKTPAWEFLQMIPIEGLIG